MFLPHNVFRLFPIAVIVAYRVIMLAQVSQSLAKPIYISIAMCISRSVALLWFDCLASRLLIESLPLPVSRAVSNFSAINVASSSSKLKKPTLTGFSFAQHHNRQRRPRTRELFCEGSVVLWREQHKASSFHEWTNNCREPAQNGRGRIGNKLKYFGGKQCGWG